MKLTKGQTSKLTFLRWQAPRWHCDTCKPDGREIFCGGKFPGETVTFHICSGLLRCQPSSSYQFESHPGQPFSSIEGLLSLKSCHLLDVRKLLLPASDFYLSSGYLPPQKCPMSSWQGRAQMRWDKVWSVKCEVWSAECEEWSVKRDLWSAKRRLVLHCNVVVRRWRSWTATVQ